MASYELSFHLAGLQPALCHIMWSLLNEGVSRTVLYVSLGYNVGAWAVAARSWYNYIDDAVILGALPFYFMKQKLVEEEGVRAVISLNMPYERQFLTTPTEEWQELGVAHMKVDIPDFVSTPSVSDMWQGIRLIKEKESQGYKTYVHCKAGRSRSATMVTAYVMLKYQLPLDEAVSFVTEKRPHVKYTELQLSTLREFKKTLSGNPDQLEPISNIRHVDEAEGSVGCHSHHRNGESPKKDASGPN